MLPWLETLKAQLTEALESERLGHAPLIQGPSGVGKRQLADWLGRRILCLSPEGDSFCGHCRSCKLLEGGTHPDFFDVGIPEEKREIPVDSIRDLTGRLQLTASLSERRVGRIMPAEAMNKNAANALLKTLEEPAGNAWVMLLSDQPGRLPATIRSRCQVVSVRPPDHDQALSWLLENAQALPDPVESELIEQSLELAGGAPLAALGLLKDGGLQFGFDVRSGLVSLARGQAIQKVLDQGWVADAPLTWRWLSIWSGMVLRCSTAASAKSELMADLPDQLAPHSAARLWEQALQGVRMARSNARQDLLLGKWLLEWSTVCNTR